MKYWSNKKKGKKLFDLESRSISVPHGYHKEIVTFKEENDDETERRSR